MEYWTKKEIQFIKSNYDKMTCKKIGEVLKRSKLSIAWKLYKLRELKIIETKNKKWTQEELKFIRENKNKMNNIEISKVLKRSRYSINGVIQVYKIKRSKKVIKKFRIEGSKNSRRTGNFTYPKRI